MKQWQITDDWSFEGLKIVEFPRPEPGPGEVLLKMKAVSLNYRDYLMVGRGYGRMSGELPLVPLSDGVGEVVALGEDVIDVAIGSRRLPCFIENWYDGDPGPNPFSGALGGYSTGIYECASGQFRTCTRTFVRYRSGNTLLCRHKRVERPR